MNAAWKGSESRIAKFFGTERRALSGGNSKSGGTDDAMHPHLYIECKHSHHIPLWNLWRDSNGKAKKEKREPIICLQEKHKPGFLTVIHSSNIVKVCKLILESKGYEVKDKQGGKGA